MLFAIDIAEYFIFTYGFSAYLAQYFLHFYISADLSGHMQGHSGGNIVDDSDIDAAFFNQLCTYILQRSHIHKQNQILSYTVVVDIFSQLHDNVVHGRTNRHINSFHNVASNQLVRSVCYGRGSGIAM